MSYDVLDVSGPISSKLPSADVRPAPLLHWTSRFTVLKRATDYFFAFGALPLVAGCALVLLVVNPFLNPGPLFFKQARMGRGGKRFAMWKFRTMAPDETTLRAHDAPLEEHRITKLGRHLRRARIDELPNIFNVIKGEMSLVGPRPDAFEHASEYLRTIPDYRYRFRVRPGITGLAQVRGGYADTEQAVRRKARLDRFYVERSCGRLDLYIIRRTFFVLLTGFGAR